LTQREKEVSHEVRVKLDTAVVGHKDVEAFVKTGNGKLGTLLISRGNVEWLPKGNSVNKRRLSWVKLGDFMEQYGKPAKAK
jgi:hypothetical protein